MVKFLTLRQFSTIADRETFNRLDQAVLSGLGIHLDKTEGAGNTSVYSDETYMVRCPDLAGHKSSWHVMSLSLTHCVGFFNDTWTNDSVKQGTSGEVTLSTLLAALLPNIAYVTHPLSSN